MGPTTPFFEYVRRELVVHEWLFSKSFFLFLYKCTFSGNEKGHFSFLEWEFVQISIFREGKLLLGRAKWQLCHYWQLAQTYTLFGVCVFRHACHNFLCLSRRRRGVIRACLCGKKEPRENCISIEGMHAYCTCTDIHTVPSLELRAEGIRQPATQSRHLFLFYSNYCLNEF